MRRSINRVVLTAGLVFVSLLTVSQSALLAVTWTGGNFDWTNPDNDSFSATYNDSNPADFLGAGTGTITVDAGGVNPSTTTVNAAAASDYTFQGGAIAGVLNKAGGNTLTLRSANSFSSVDIGGGTIDFDDNDRLGAGTINFSGDSRLLLFKPGGSDTIPNNISIANDTTATFQYETTGLTFVTGIISGGTLANPTRIVFSNLTAAGGTGSFDQVRLSTSNTFVGEIEFRDRAHLNMNGDGNFGDASNSILMAGLQPGILLNGNDLTRDIQFDGQGFFSSGTLSGVLSGGGGIRVNGGTVTLTNTGNASGLTGNYEINTGTLEFSDPDAIGSGALSLVNTGRVIRITGTPVASFGNTINNSSPSTNGVIDVADPAASIDWTGNLAGAAPRTTIKRGAGELNLSSITFTGGFIVEDGTLNINTTTPNELNYLVEDSGTLGGTGTINLTAGNNVTIQSGGAIAPGMSAGLLTLDGNAAETAIDFNSGSTYVWEIDALADDNTGTAGIEFDQLVVSAGDIVIDSGAAVELSFGSGLNPDEGDAFWGEDHIWTILSNAGGGTSNDLFGSLVNGSFDRGEFELLNSAGDIQLLFTAQVPEPSTAAMLLLGGAVLAGRRRRRALKKS